MSALCNNVLFIREISNNKKHFLISDSESTRVVFIIIIYVNNNNDYYHMWYIYILSYTFHLDHGPRKSKSPRTTMPTAAFADNPPKIRAKYPSRDFLQHHQTNYVLYLYIYNISSITYTICLYIYNTYTVLSCVHTI